MTLICYQIYIKEDLSNDYKLQLIQFKSQMKLFRKRMFRLVKSGKLNESYEYYKLVMKDKKIKNWTIDDEIIRLFYTKYPLYKDIKLYLRVLQYVLSYDDVEASVEVLFKVLENFIDHQ